MQFYETKWFKITGIVLLVLLLGFAMFKMVKGEEKKPADEGKPQSEQVMDTEPEKEPTVEVGEEPVGEDGVAVDEKTSEEMARRASCYENAKFNLTIRPYSRKNLIKYMMSKQGGGYSKEDAEFAVTKLEQNEEVDWNEQCSRTLLNYLGENSMPEKELLQQLTSDDGEGYTEEQAKKALEDWK